MGQAGAWPFFEVRDGHQPRDFCTKAPFPYHHDLRWWLPPLLVWRRCGGFGQWPQPGKWNVDSLVIQDHRQSSNEDVGWSATDAIMIGRVKVFRENF